MGAGFSFVARQKRIQLDGDDFYIDPLLCNRKLKRLVAVELKQGVFRPEYRGQMELYLRWLAKYEREKGEEAPLGIILCAGASAKQVELLELGAAGIHVRNTSPSFRRKPCWKKSSRRPPKLPGINPFVEVVMTTALTIASPPEPISPMASAYDGLRRAVLNGVAAENSKRNYELALDELSAFCEDGNSRSLEHTHPGVSRGHARPTSQCLYD